MSSAPVGISAISKAPGESFPWFAIRVKPNREKVTASHFAGRGIDCFLPTYALSRQWSDRVKIVEFPLFPGYLFGSFNPARRSPVLSIPGVLNIVSCGSELVPVDEDELEAIRRVTREGTPAEPWPFLEAGRLIRVMRGPLTGIQGIVVEVKNECRIVLRMSLLQRSILVQVDRSCIEPVM